ncbi:MAG: hypothetical protein IMZ71_02000 [Chloroflexi bacterium]|nr:hypothetical protein [Chloroflexota bacterium]
MTQPMPYAIPTMYCPKCGMPLYAGMGCGTHDPMKFRCMVTCGYAVDIPLSRFRFPVEPEAADVDDLALHSNSQEAKP